MSGESVDAEKTCARCGKPQVLCVCEAVTPLRSRVQLVILQHPQEQDRLLGTAQLAAAHFADASVKIGLSWPSLSRLLGRSVDPARWAVLYLGSAKVSANLPGGDLVLVDRNGEPEPHQGDILADLEGVIVLDGNWSQAKALWWRNPWMLRCRRIVLGPSRPSLYGELRREPRPEGLSTIEAAARVLSRLQKRPDIEAAMDASFAALLARYRELASSRPDVVPPPKPAPKRDWRRRGGRKPGR
jgi:DTW domain-containing protein YfiP